MLHPRELLPAVIFAACLISCCTSCSPDIGQPLHLSQFSGEWFLAAGTPMNGSLSRCGRFLVKETAQDAFQIRYTAVSTKKNIPIAFNVDGTANGKRIIGTWQLEGSQKILGPFRHVIVFARYKTVLGMLVCSESVSRQQGYKFAMIWSRERSLPPPMLKSLKYKLEAYINHGEIQIVDHENC